MIQTNKGFTLIELLVVISIIGVLASATLASLNDARNNAKVTAAKAQLRYAHASIVMLQNDTGVTLGGFSPTACMGTNSQNQGNGIYLSDSRAGLTVNSIDLTKYPGWSGPYLSQTMDPWGQEYKSETHYRCTAGEVAVLEGKCAAGEWVNALVSGGPNKSGFNQYDTDNVTYVICKH